MDSREISLALAMAAETFASTEDDDEAAAIIVCLLWSKARLNPLLLLSLSFFRSL
jgi:hypothetical protein